MRRAVESLEEVVARHFARQSGADLGPRHLFTLRQLWDRYRARQYYRCTRSRRLWLKKLRRCGVTEVRS